MPERTIGSNGVAALRESGARLQAGARITLSTMVALTIAAASHSALAGGDAKVGGWLARHWCGSCHSLGTGYASDAAPTLEAIAKAPNHPEGWVRAWLISPHPRMPNFTLSRVEIDDIVAYLDSLRAP